uniref:Uncharacterized protein n=1 Tax=Rhizophora mucronata TaxID=61149 RepID=A0A2P2MUI1_RHIMU
MNDSLYFACRFAMGVMKAPLEINTVHFSS